MFLVISLLGFTGGLFFIWIAYKVIRPVFPARVNCWFCQNWTTVPYTFRNNWECPSCEQYNGFDQDGNYNKVIPGQRLCEFESSTQYSAIHHDPIPPKSHLCASCSRNQILKVKQLASFVPFNESSYEEEVECYRHHLEQVYRLCRVCSAVTEQEILKKDKAILSQLSPDLRQKCHQISTSVSTLQQDGRLMNTFTISKLLNVLSWICCLNLLVSYLPSCVESGNIKGDNLTSIVCWSSKFVDRTVIIFLGLFIEISSKLIIGKHRIYLIDGLNCLSWLILAYSNLLQESINLPYLTGLNLCTVTVVMATLSLLQSRKPRNRTNITMRRLSLGNSSMEEDTSIAETSTRLFDNVTSSPVQPSTRSWGKCVPWDSVTRLTRSSAGSVYQETSSTQPVQRSPDIDKLKRPFGEFRSVAPTFSNFQRPPMFSADVVNKHPGHFLGHNTDSMFRVIQKPEKVGSPVGSMYEEVSSSATRYRAGTLPDQSDEDLDLELSSINLGGSALKRNKGLYSSLPTFSSIQSVPSYSSHLLPSSRQRRPLISPAKFNMPAIGASRHKGFKSSWQDYSFSSKPFPVLSDSQEDLTSLLSTTGKTGSVWDRHDKHSANTEHEERCPVDSTTGPIPQKPLLLPKETTQLVPSVVQPWCFYVLVGGLALSVITNITVLLVTVRAS